MLKKLTGRFPIIIAPVVILILVSIIKFQIWNPIIVIEGLIKIKFSDVEIIELNEDPKIVLAKPSADVFIKYMKDSGYDVIEEERLGSMYVFYNHLTGTKSEVFCNMNGYYSLWTWN